MLFGDLLTISSDRCRQNTHPGELFKHIIPATDAIVEKVDPTFKKLGIVSGTRHLISSEGPAALLTGFGPSMLRLGFINMLRLLTDYFTAAVGYLVQGGAKFAGYEYWKQKFVI